MERTSTEDITTDNELCGWVTWPETRARKGGRKELQYGCLMVGKEREGDLQSDGFGT